MRRYAADALAAARALDDPPLIASAAGILALAEYHLPDVTAARPLLDEAAARLDALTDDQLAGRLDAALFVGWGEQCLARWDDVHRHYERALRVARATGQGYLLIPMTIGRAIAYLWQGELAAAAELADEAIEAARLSGNAQSVSWTLTTRCWIATLAGDLDLALSTGAEAHATQLPRSHWSALTACYLAEAHLEAGDHEHGRQAAAARAAVRRARVPDALVRGPDARRAGRRPLHRGRPPRRPRRDGRVRPRPARAHERGAARPRRRPAGGGRQRRRHPRRADRARARRTASATGSTRPARNCSPARRSPPAATIARRRPR